MKKICSLILMVLLLVGGLAGCNQRSFAEGDGSDKDDSDIQVFEADVIENENGLLISPDQESVEFSSSDKISVGLIDAKIFDKEGNLVDKDVLISGDRIKVYYNGIILESYPAQISAQKIEVIGHNHIVDGMFSLIDDVYQEDSALNHDISMIAFNTAEWTALTKAEIYTILAMAHNQYDLEIVQGTFDELAEQGLIDKEKLYFENGILIELNDLVIDEDRETINSSIRKWRSGKGAIGWKGEAKLDGDQWKITRSNMWIS
ncbi:MAG: DUF3221 domain-containing protein [Clostridiales bacterium]|nr:DUF3221 domain-containing protein [Clostridiales bacterium]